MHAHRLIHADNGQELIEHRHQHRPAANAEEPGHEPGDDAGGNERGNETQRLAGEKGHIHGGLLKGRWRADRKMRARGQPIRSES